MSKSKCVLGIVFICSMEYLVCFLCCKTRGKVVSKETVRRRNGVMRRLRRLRWQRVSSDVRGIVFAVV